MYRSRNVRWVARRPPESFPQRRQQVYRGPRLIPRYTYLPRWGLRDDPIDEHRLDAPAERASETLRSALVISAGALAASAVVHLLRYIPIRTTRRILTIRIGIRSRVIRPFCRVHGRLAESVRHKARRRCCIALALRFFRHDRRRSIVLVVFYHSLAHVTQASARPLFEHNFLAHGGGIGGRSGVQR